MNTLHSNTSLEFSENPAFETELNKQVDHYFAQSNQSRTATSSVYLKAWIIMLSLVTSYLLLVFVADSLWQGFIFAAWFGFSVMGIGVNLQHDGAHNAFSKRHWVNRMMAMSLDLIGASSYYWQWKHNRFHHSFTNIAPFDTDISLGVLGRISPSGKRLWFHRWQHFYIWFLYTFLVIKWQLFDDFSALISRKMENRDVPRPLKNDLVVLILGKVIFLTWAFGIPLLLHPVEWVFVFYGFSMMIAGITLSLIFILPHGVEEADFPLPDPTTHRMANSRSVHQVRVTVDFVRRVPLITWLVGGLNYHREHHLFPLICHIHYPKIAEIIDRVCDEFGILHKEHSSVFTGLASHFRLLRQLGKQDSYTIAIQPKLAKAMS